MLPQSQFFTGDRVVNVYQNGDMEKRKCESISLNKNIEIKQLWETIRSGFHVKERRFRLFNLEGVELFQEDLPYVKHGSVLYFSKGEEFDARSSFSEYESIRELGEGGFGKVILGQHRVTGEKVAIKIVKTNQIGNAEQIDMVFREAEMLKSLHHKNIVRIHNCYTLPNMEVVFVMEYLEGGELLEYVIKKGHLSEEEACEFFVQITEGISYCHQQKLIHRDLKLENILLADESSKLVKIVDFGIAGLASNFNISKVDVGTLRYMPPESLTGKISEIGYPIDVWALGIILYGMVAGTLPFDGDTPQDIVKQVIKLKYKVPPDTSEDLKNLWQRIFVQDPHKRIKVPQILEHPWVIANCKAQNSETGYRIFLQQQALLLEPEKRASIFQRAKRKGTKKVGISNDSEIKETIEVHVEKRKQPQQRAQSTTVKTSVPRTRDYLLPQLTPSYDLLQMKRQLREKQIMVKYCGDLILLGARRIAQIYISNSFVTYAIIKFDSF